MRLKQKQGKGGERHSGGFSFEEVTISTDEEEMHAVPIGEHMRTSANEGSFGDI